MTNPFVSMIVADEAKPPRAWSVLPNEPGRAVVSLDVLELQVIEQYHLRIGRIFAPTDPELGAMHFDLAGRIGAARASVAADYAPKPLPVRTLLDPETGRDSQGRQWVPRFPQLGVVHMLVPADHAIWIADRYSDRARELIQEGADRATIMDFASTALDWRSRGHKAEPRYNAHLGVPDQPRKSGSA